MSHEFFSPVIQHPASRASSCLFLFSRTPKSSEQKKGSASRVVIQVRILEKRKSEFSPYLVVSLAATSRRATQRKATSRNVPPGEERCVTRHRTAARETTHLETQEQIAGTRK